MELILIIDITRPLTGSVFFLLDITSQTVKVRLNISGSTPIFGLFDVLKKSSDVGKLGGLVLLEGGGTFSVCIGRLFWIRFIYWPALKFWAGQKKRIKFSAARARLNHKKYFIKPIYTGGHISLNLKLKLIAIRFVHVSCSIRLSLWMNIITTVFRNSPPHLADFIFPWYFRLFSRFGCCILLSFWFILVFPIVYFVFSDRFVIR